MSEKFTLLLSGKPLDIVFTLDENEWNGQKKLQLKVIDMRIQTIEFNTMLPV
jgi:single-stranded-DNA-specific exonuclease